MPTVLDEAREWEQGLAGHLSFMIEDLGAHYRLESVISSGQADELYDLFLHEAKNRSLLNLQISIRDFLFIRGQGESPWSHPWWRR